MIARAMPPYVVRPGDHLSQIAFRHRVLPERVWNDPRNASLRAAGRSPEQLAPGDVLFLPEAPPSPLNLRAGAFNAYRVEPPKVEVPLSLQTDEGPLRDTEVEIEGLGAPQTFTTDARGRVVIKVPTHVRSVNLHIPARGLRMHLAVGGLDPITTDAGVFARLVNLGMAEPSAGGSFTPEMLREALLAFQRAHELPTSGLLDTPTRDALTREHGT